MSTEYGCIIPATRYYGYKALIAVYAVYLVPRDMPKYLERWMVEVTRHGRRLA
jgi:hypothetical protein